METYHPDIHNAFHYPSRMSDSLDVSLQKLAKDGASVALREAFRHVFARVQAGESGIIAESEIKPVGNLFTLEEAAVHRATGESALKETALIKLNGGLGTGMGLDKAKSLLPVKNGLTFLDLIARQTLHLRNTLGIPLPLLLMNSFSTEADTLHALKRYPKLAQRDIPLSFLQNRIPKLRADTLEPISWPNDPEKEWCPPGHGDIYAALAGSGTLTRLLNAGFNYAFVSNADNLGAGLDAGILGYLVTTGAPFLMEVTARTGMDRKGGHLAEWRNGGLLLRESAQCHEDDVENFQDITTHRFFNTNNLWLNLVALDRFMNETGSPPDLPVMINRKTVDPRDPASPAVLQLETAMGAAIAVLPNSKAIEIPRTRFAPVKTTDDLLALWSDAYALGDDARLSLKPHRNGKPPTVRLDPKFYKHWPDFSARFPHGAPSLTHCETFTVEGDICFGENVTIEGNVKLANPNPGQLTITDQTIRG